MKSLSVRRLCRSEIIFIEPKSIEVTTGEQHKPQSINDCCFPCVILTNNYTKPSWETHRKIFDLPKVSNLNFS